MKFFGKKETNQNIDNLDEFTMQIISDAKQCIECYKTKYNNKLDYSVKSLGYIENILEETRQNNHLLNESEKAKIIIIVGSYIFEVARKNYGGKYYWYEKGNQPILVTGQPKFEVSIIAMDKVKGRIENGKEDDIVFYFQGFVDKVEQAKPGYKCMIV
jgi:hypothetical protein